MAQTAAVPWVAEKFTHCFLPLPLNGPQQMGGPGLLRSLVSVSCNGNKIVNCLDGVHAT